MGSRALKTNFTINVAGALVPLAVALVATPIYVRHIGDARYGVLSIVWVLLGYLGFLDFGLSRAAANALARLRTAPQPERAAVLVTTLGLNLALGLVGSVVLALGGGYLLGHVLSVPDALKPEIASAFPWIVGLFPLALVAGVGVGALESRERFLVANLLTVSGMAAGQIVPVILATTVSPSLAVVVPAAAIMRGLTVMAILLVVWRSEGPLRFRHFDRRQARKLLSYGGWVTVSGVISPVLTSSDQFVIGTVLGVASVAHYAVPMSLVMRSQVFPSALARTLFPRMSQAGGEEARRLAVRAWLSLTFGYGAICAPAILLTPLFFRHWIGADFAAVAAPIGQILFLGAWINGLAFVPYELLQSQGRPDVTGKFHAAEVLPFTALLWGATAVFGLKGAAIAWSLRCGVDALLLFRASRLSGRDLAPAALPLGLMLLALAASRLVIDQDLWLSLGATAVVAVLSTGLAVVMAEDLRRLLFQVAARFGRTVWPGRIAVTEPE
jgi:O-antigen/teichoic acid export membrane protein